MLALHLASFPLSGSEARRKPGLLILSLPGNQAQNAPFIRLLYAGRVSGRTQNPSSVSLGR